MLHLNMHVALRDRSRVAALGEVARWLRRGGESRLDRCGPQGFFPRRIRHG
jgi:hypothetical protein